MTYKNQLKQNYTALYNTFVLRITIANDKMSTIFNSNLHLVMLYNYYTYVCTENVQHN